MSPAGVAVLVAWLVGAWLLVCLGAPGALRLARAHVAALREAVQLARERAWLLRKLDEERRGHGRLLPGLRIEPCGYCGHCGVHALGCPERDDTPDDYRTRGGPRGTGR